MPVDEGRTPRRVTVHASELLRGGQVRTPGYYTLFQLKLTSGFGSTGRFHSH
jgi:hypothetical protein